ncbi:MAG: efflux RND transporter periplasmic adaptor subunit [Aureliella sp.]
MRSTLCVCSLFTFITSTQLLSSVLAETVVVEGFSRPYRISRVAAPNAGVLLERIVECGEAVREGQEIASLDSEVFAKSLTVARMRMEQTGELDNAKVDVDSAKQRLTILADLGKRSHASHEEITRAEADFQRALARYQIAVEQQRVDTAEYDRLKAQADRYHVRAPFDGVIVEYSKEKGEWVGQVDPHVCTVAELSVLSVDFLVPSYASESLEIGQSVSVVFADADSTAEGTVQFVAPYPNAETNTVEVHVKVDNQDRKLNAGLRCSIHMEVPSLFDIE